MKLTSNLKIVAAFTIFMFIAGWFLFYVETKNQDPAHNKQWSAIYLLNPTQADLSFAIENYQGMETEYEWRAENESGNVLKSGQEKIGLGEKKEIDLKNITKGEITVSWAGGEKVLKKQ
ncbi:MAG: hypothetical protein ABIC19_01050 [Patescibacteria group bacterium]|nr:hypothetical protein [Patescibacteria group bacterium]